MWSRMDNQQKRCLTACSKWSPRKLDRTSGCRTTVGSCKSLENSNPFDHISWSLSVSLFLCTVPWGRVYTSAATCWNKSVKATTILIVLSWYAHLRWTLPSVVTTPESFSLPPSIPIPTVPLFLLAFGSKWTYRAVFRRWSVSLDTYGVEPFVVVVDSALGYFSIHLPRLSARTCLEDRLWFMHCLSVIIKFDRLDRSMNTVLYNHHVSRKQNVLLPGEVYTQVALRCVTERKAPVSIMMLWFSYWHSTTVRWLKYKPRLTHFFGLWPLLTILYLMTLTHYTVSIWWSICRCVSAQRLSNATWNVPYFQ